VAPDEADDARDTFVQIYNAEAWGGGSGVGSARDATAPYRDVLQRLVRSQDVAAVVDVGCGDWQLGALVDWSTVTYTGLDVVPAVIEANQHRYGQPGVQFELADARHAQLPVADLLLVKDVLQHWPNGDIGAFLHTHLDRYRYVLLTNDVASVHWPGPVNADMALGGWRTLDLEVAPFQQPAVWRNDYDVRGEWTKRMLLYASKAAQRRSFWSLSALQRLSRTARSGSTRGAGLHR